MNPILRMAEALAAVWRRRWPTLDWARVRRLVMVELAARQSYGLELATRIRDRYELDLGSRIYSHLHDLERDGLLASWTAPGSATEARGDRPVVLYRLTTAGCDWLDASSCTGVSASWCPRCGSCTCTRLESGEVEQVLVDRNGRHHPTERLFVKWPEGGEQGWSPAHIAPQAALDFLGLHWERDGQAGCPLHDPASTHAEGEWRAPDRVLGG